MQSYTESSIVLFDIDYSNDSLDDLLVKFIRMREMALFRRNMKQKYSNGKRCPTLQERLADYQPDFSDAPSRSFRSINTELYNSDEENDSCVDNLAVLSRLEIRSIRDQRSSELPLSVASLYNSAQWKKIWSCIRSRLDSMTADQMALYLEYETRVLEIHVTHRVSLDPLCYGLMLDCIQPALIAQLFSRQLIEPRDLFHIDCLFDSENIFDELMKPVFSQTPTKAASYIVLSTTCLIYKTRCIRKKDKIIKAMNKKLRHYVMLGRFHKSFKTACKFFFNALMTCGILNRGRLADYLNGPFIDDSDSSISSDDEFNDDDDDDMEFDLAERVRRQPDIIGEEDELSNMSDDSELDMEILNEEREVINMDRFEERRQPDNGAQPARPSVGRNLNLNIDELNQTSALSLKNLCRLVIKSRLTEYTTFCVHKLTMLPEDLKEYLLYEPECNSIVAFANHINN